MLRRLVNNERGGVIVLFALALTVFSGLAGLVVDVGYLYLQHARLQNGVDAACLAGAAYLPSAASASDVAGDYAEENGLARAKLTSAFANGNRRLELTYTESFETFFLRVLGIDSASIRVAAAAELVVGGPFGFTIFSGSDTDILPLNGSSLYVDGSVHSDQRLRINGSGITVTGNIEAAGRDGMDGDIQINGTNINILGTRSENAARIPMPDYSAQIQAIAAQRYATSQSFNGGDINIDGSIYVNGEVSFNGNNISGSGSVLATGDIHNNGNNITQTGDGDMFLYSQNGDIHINGNDIAIDATLYAPNGNIIINGNNITINGRVVGNTVTINGTGIRVSGESNPVTVLPGTPRLVE
ncbi:MAG: Tad domain-containing protein [Sporomusaceae bacterium]|nr:Tad domain-containing protein [Sporomusaceae bacterium]